MKAARCPRGMHTEVDIKIQLRGTARRIERHWSTPIALAPAYHKALRWIREDAKLPERTQLERIQLEVRYVAGDYVDDDTTTDDSVR